MLDYHSFKKINEFFTQGRNDEARRMLMELQSRYIALRDEMSTLKTQVQAFEDIIFLSKSLHFDRQFYWIKIADVKQGPFCPCCYDRDGTLMKLEGLAHALHCAYCGSEYARAQAVGAEQVDPRRRHARLIPFAGL